MNASSRNINLEELLPITSKTKSKSTSNSSNTTTTALPYSSCTTLTHCSNSSVLGLSCHHGDDQSEQNNREFNEHPLTGGTRWNPTPEQLLALEEMYRRGTRTPTAEQIQQIAAQLRRFGKIEGKNVFYWFQNHKARERQKRRREMEANYKSRKHDHTGSLDNNINNKYSGLRRTAHELEQKKNLLVPSSNCSDQHIERPFSNGAATAESTPPFEKRELHQHKSGSLEKNSTWHYATNSYASFSPIHLINSTHTTNSRLINLQMQSSWFNSNSIIEEVETLELFPLSNSAEGARGSKDQDGKVPIRAINTKLSPNQYFEFLPLKN